MNTTITPADVIADLSMGLPVTDAELTAALVLAEGVQLQRLWREVHRRIEPAVRQAARRGIDSEELSGDIRAHVAEALPQWVCDRGPVENLERWVHNTTYAGMLRRTADAAALTRGVTGLRPLAVIQAHQQTRDEALLGTAGAERVRAAEGRTRDRKAPTAGEAASLMSMTRDAAPSDDAAGEAVILRPHSTPVAPAGVRRAVEDALATLTPQDAELARLRYGLDGAEPIESWETLGALTGLSRDQVRVAIQRITRSLRRALADRSLDDIMNTPDEPSEPERLATWEDILAAADAD